MSGISGVSGVSARDIPLQLFGVGGQGKGGGPPEELPVLPQQASPPPPVPTDQAAQQVQTVNPLEANHQRFQELDRLVRLSDNTFANTNVSLRFGVLQNPSQLFVQVQDSRNDATLQTLPPDFLLKFRATLQAMIADPAFNRVTKGMMVNTQA